ncbi:MAG: endonuclease domain-containing protein, partial [Iodobacter sp.]
MNKLMRDRARQLRTDATPFEQSLWQELRARRFSGFKFRRQQVIGRYIVDFVCLSGKLIIELDGSQHADATACDAERDTWLQSEGYRVLRVWNNEWAQQPQGVLEKLWEMLNMPSPQPLPPNGGGASHAS